MIVDIRSKAIDVALSLTSGAYQTSLVSYFAHRDLFPALIKVSMNVLHFLWYLPLVVSLVLESLSVHLSQIASNLVLVLWNFLRYRLIACFLAVHTRL